MTFLEQTGPYIPRRDAGARQWLNNFAMLVSAQPAAYGLTPADAVTLDALAKQFDAAFERASEPKTRSSPSVAEKDAIRNQALATFRVYAQQIKKNLGVSDQQKLELGLRLDDRTPTPIPAPRTWPILHIVGAQSGLHVLRYADVETPAARRKPHGVTHLLLYVVIGDEPATDPTEAIFVGAFTTQPFEVAYDAEQAGQTATYFGRWVTARGLEGPWSLPVSMMIAFGGGRKESQSSCTTPDRGQPPSLRASVVNPRA